MRGGLTYCPEMSRLGCLVLLIEGFQHPSSLLNQVMAHFPLTYCPQSLRL
uniref:Uncharacterized protein n=1 Tax=Rhizophora mucronata TaxID=61149 RepID=A0A2P2J739_RHIMU